VRLIASLVRESFRLAVEKRPGAVHLELPEDIADEECAETVFPPIGHPHATEDALREATSMIETAKARCCWLEQVLTANALARH
jgi:acetolactate synthase-1/2/3 large subunit